MDNIVSARWHHIAASWSNRDGLSVYINGILRAQDLSPRRRTPADREYNFNDFIIGWSNNNQDSHRQGTILVDELNFWSLYNSEQDIREIGE